MLHVICDTWTCGDLEIWMVQWRILRYCVCHATCIGSSQQKWCRMNKLLHMWDAGTCRHVSTRARTAPCLCGTHARHVCVGTRLTRVGMRATRATWNGGSHICTVASAIHREDVLTLEVATLLYSRRHDATLSVLMSRVWKFVIGSSAALRSLCGSEESQVGVSDDCDDDALRNAPLASKCVILENLH